MNSSTITQADREVAKESALGNAKRIRDNAQEPQIDVVADYIVKTLESDHPIPQGDALSLAEKICEHTDNPDIERLADNIARNITIILKADGEMTEEPEEIR